MTTFTQKIAHNTLVQIIGKAVSTFLGLTAVVVMTHYLGREGYGQYTTIIAFLQFFGIIIDFGLTLTTVRTISQPGADEQKIVSNIFTLRFWSALAFLGLAPLLALFFPYPSIIKTGIAFTTLSFLFISLQQIQVGVFQKKLRMDKVMIAEVIGRIVLLGGIVLVAFWGWGLLAVMGAIVAGSFFTWLATFIFIRHYLKYSWAYDFSLWKKIIITSWPIGISIIFNLLYLKADIIILSVVRSQAEVGLYGAPYRVIDILTMLPMMFVGLVLPTLTTQWARKNLPEFKKIFQMTFNFMTILALPIMVGAQFLAKDLMTLIAGQEFALSGSILRILILAQGVIFFGTIFGHLIVAINKQRVMLVGYVVTAILSLSAYFIFIPRYSYYGAAWVTVFSEVLIMALTFAVFYKTTRILPSLKVAGKALLASLLMAVFLVIASAWHVLILLLAAIVVYFAALYLFKGFNKDLVLEILKSR